MSDEDRRKSRRAKQAAWRRAWRQKHPEKAREADRNAKRDSAKIAAQRRARYLKNPETARARERIRYRKDPAKYRLKRLKADYGIDAEQFAAMLASQGGLCAIDGCGRRATDVDHSHATGRVRELLCGGCNAALGRISDCPARISGLAKYAEKHVLVRYDKPAQETALEQKANDQLTLFA